MAAVIGALAILPWGCAAPPRGPAPVPAPVPAPAPAATPEIALVDSFIRKVVAGEHEAAFADLDIRTLVNFGRPQWERYRGLTPADQERYRRDFVEGVYAYLFRDLPPSQASYSVAAPDPGGPLVQVTGRPGKTLRLVVQGTPAGPKIVIVERE